MEKDKTPSDDSSNYFRGLIPSLNVVSCKKSLWIKEYGILEVLL